MANKRDGYTGRELVDENRRDLLIMAFFVLLTIICKWLGLSVLFLFFVCHIKDTLDVRKNEKNFKGDL